ncbi:MAG TPA: DapH/DapD/GlmU-related protein [Ramlibacter sp.]|jgi:acetyltransferase-like isoleucine patch superfamily enzyme|uniref:acyltransferase n=1 Tax=Ramlibacter sp. TaxID=1917967 RepID=UPI002D25BB51|nr:DapH/DapD/GlmU-related protein [Ramlibacter sp.]HZY20336.1 DapH/DapD/GlmU-related protein [Ramlibacter sp.]
MSLLRRAAFGVYPAPRGIGALGAGSAVLLPRRVQGAPRIEIGPDVIVQPHGWLAAVEQYAGQHWQPRIEIGAHCRIGRHAVITAVEDVTLGEGCLLSEQVFISDHAHGAQPGALPPARQPLVPLGPVRIGRHCFIGIRACILGGVTLGDHCVVGANAVVTHSFPSGSVLAGAPARLVRTLPLPSSTRHHLDRNAV